MRTETIFVIQDVETKKYYCKGRMEEYFSANISDAYTFLEIDSALKEIQETKEWEDSSFEGKFLEIKKYVFVPNQSH